MREELSGRVNERVNERDRERARERKKGLRLRRHPLGTRYRCIVARHSLMPKRLHNMAATRFCSKIINLLTGISGGLTPHSLTHFVLGYQRHTPYADPNQHPSTLPPTRAMSAHTTALNPNQITERAETLPAKIMNRD